MITVTMCSCINKPEREEYLRKSVENIKDALPEAEIIIAFDKNTGIELDGCRTYSHDKGMGHSFNWAIQNASNDIILQTEDDWTIEYNQPEMMTKEDFITQLHQRIDVIKEFGGMYRLDNMTHSWYTPGYKSAEFNGYEHLELNRPPKGTSPYTSFDGYFYSNHPHLKHKSLHDKLGYYNENVPPHITELEMAKKFLEGTERVFFSPFNTFVHIGHTSARQ